MPRLYNHQEQKSLRQYLRIHATRAEQALWDQLRSRRLCGKKFRRQHGIGKYVVDFYCPELRLVIEVDGDSHSPEDAKKYDAARDAFLRSCGLDVIRLQNDEVLSDMEGVLERLKLVLHHP